MEAKDKLTLAYSHLCSILLDDLEELVPLEESTRIRLFRIKNLLTDLMKDQDE